MGRIAEKSILKRPDDPGSADKVCDIVRDMFVCEGMDEKAELLARFRSEGLIAVRRGELRIPQVGAAAADGQRVFDAHWWEEGGSKRWK